ncbi:glycoside hydrolase family 13 protein [Hyaloscypha bicolor E]|uniref:Glycoside hydrolase family 13 protein n=1 Tax=Hyaloscypha bicolor E TaxID=1095630 RepID=A0A2J6TMP3_9HELO|nr:glycoside hydrolase family 13 protein [Hyaloscypha bicolor E]PMD64238.1 glycoside hydrolase family 13 protein [Hyaloscypha bicolor E]
MTPAFDLLERRKDKFMLWIPAGLPNASPPFLVLSAFEKGPPPPVNQSTRSQFIHSQNTRFFTDVVMAFGHEPYVYIDFKQFHLDQNAPEEAKSPDRWQSNSEGARDGYGGRLWRYSWPVDANGEDVVTSSYDPESGQVANIHPSWAFHKGHVHRWMTSFGSLNYITSHDTEGGLAKERLYNFLSDSGVTDMERRAKFAFALFLTAVGIPMIFAGEEFLDQMDRPVGDKQSDPVNYERKSEDWRTRIFNYVANMVQFRKSCPALGDNDTEFIHVDQSRGGKIMAWKRGDQDTEGSEYVVANWPDKDKGGWREVTQQRDVPAEWVGREPLMHWEAKVYTYWSG